MRNSPIKFIGKTITKMKNPFNQFGFPTEKNEKKSKKSAWTGLHLQASMVQPIRLKCSIKRFKTYQSKNMQNNSNNGNTINYNNCFWGKSTDNPMKNCRTLPLTLPTMIRRKSHHPAIMEDRVSFWVWWVIRASHCSTDLSGSSGHSDLLPISPFFLFHCFSHHIFLFRMGERRRQEKGMRRKSKIRGWWFSFLSFLYSVFEQEGRTKKRKNK